MKFLVFLFCVVLLTVNVNSQTPSQEALDFFIGFAEGLEIEIGDPSVCAKDLNITEKDLIDGFTLISQGIEDINIAKVEKGLQLWADALIEVSDALRDCGAGKIADDVENIAKEISSGTTGLLEFIAREVLAIIENDVQKLFLNAVAAVDAKDYKTAGLDSGKIVGILLNQNQ